MNFPTNIKQIGTIDDGMKIYVEDYVYSYLKQYAKSNDYKESLAVLMGKYMEIDKTEVVFISGAIQGKHLAESNGLISFTDKSWEYVLEQKELFFNDLEVVGWMQSQPSYGTYLNASCANYHLNNFRKPYQVLFIYDPVEKVNSFFAYSKDLTDIIEKKGYFIYYDKNNEMHEYMVANKIAGAEKEKSKDPTLKYITEKREKRQSAVIAKDLSDWIPDEKENPKSLITKDENEFQAQKKALNLLVSLCVVLFVTSFIMGMGLMNNQDRIATLEENLSTLTTTYKDLVQSSEVFAQANKNTVKEGDNTNLIVENGNDYVDNPDKSNLTEENIINGETNDENLPTDAGTTYTEESAEPSAETDSEDADKIPEFYVVQSGDTLLKISEKIYGTRKMAGKIMEFNKMKDADKIVIGKKLLLPPKSE